MRIRKYLPVIVAITVLCGTVQATEFRSPLIVERGPMRYVFEEWEDSDYGLKVWTACYGRESHKAFMKHGTKTKPLSALFFNKSCFTLNEIFPNSCVDVATEYYNPFVGLTKLQPRITYEEKGLSLGARYAYPVYKDKGRVGLRIQVPFRKIEIEREDSGDKDTNQLDDLLTGEVVTRINSPTAAPPGDDRAIDVFARAVRMDFLQKIPYTSSGLTILRFDANGLPLIVGDNANWLFSRDDDAQAQNRMAAIIQSPAGTIPRDPDRLLGIHEDPVTDPTPLPADGLVGNNNAQYVFGTFTGVTPPNVTDVDVDYSALNINDCSSSTRAAALAATDDLWITSVHKKGNGGTQFSTGSEKLWSTLDLALKNYNENAYEWLADRCFEFESETRSGLGDIDLDLFYEHQFDEDVVGEVMIGVRIPTGYSDNYTGNPYRPHLGNGEHWEIKLGGMIAWQPLDWMNMKLDGRFAFVLEGEEKRMATFKGACVKNIGPCVKADVHWEYFVLNYDLNLFHPKTDAISCLIGYELYYKTKDSICYKARQMQSWLGKKYNNTTATFVEDLRDLDSSVATKYTQAIGHKIRFESSFRINRYFEIFCGGTYTFAGKYIPRECDCHGGFVVTF